ncbi:uncharacterized protein LOC135072854 [Ostrinia nubilalis]|uniref:uncharacterized protein LOC135072854 n=1 Tax=Ostrinia nubilalis TaxID=29057 RepID=UPI0030825D17
MARHFAIMDILVTLSAVVFLLGVCGVNGDYSVRCSNVTNAKPTLQPSKDGVKARYILEWCTDANANDTVWKYELTYPEPKNRFSIHTSCSELLNWTEPLPCSSVCLSTVLDLVFKANYSLKSWFPGRGSFGAYSRFNIVNDYRREDFSNTNIKGSDINHGDYTSVYFYTENIPATKYILTLCQGFDKDHGLEERQCRVVTDKCGTPHSLYEVECRLRLRAGNYTVGLEFDTAWARGSFVHKWYHTRNISVVNLSAATVSNGDGAGARTALVWACAGGAALCVGAGLLLLALRCRRARHFRKHVLREWLHREETKQAAPETAAPGPILLLYARECAAAEPVVAALSALLETVAPGQVYDICSAETLALAASGGPHWLRGVMAQPTARVVLLQTPALQALHTPRIVMESGVPKLEQPLLSSRAVYREPAAGDWLLQFALRALAETTTPGTVPYKKYYLATLEGLETEALPYTVPFRRYVLPRHAATLLHDLLPSQEPAHTPHMVDSLARATIDFVDYARAHPDYLMEELLIL